MAMSSRVEDLKQHLEQNAENLSQSWEIRRSNLGGRGLFATKPIQKGILIFMNKPLAIGPRIDRSQVAFCSICFEISESCEKCDKCFLMICSQNCKSATRHNEKCDFITTNWNLKETSTRELSEMLIYLDCLLLSSDQMSMLSWLQKSKFSNVNSSELKEFLAKNIIPEHQVEVINMVYTVLKINSFRVSANSQKKTVPLRALYPLSAFLNHSCIPNTRNVFNEEYSMAVYASRDIKPGEEIVTCYTGLLLCTPARRIQMYKTKRFWCNCERCSDVTEMGTRLSALKCLDKDCIGVLMPVTPLDPQCEWQCDNCSAIQSTARVSAIQGVLGSLVGALNLDDHLQLETFLLERLAVLIPYSNHIFVDMRLRLALNLGFVEDLKMIGIIRMSFDFVQHD